MSQKIDIISEHSIQIVNCTSEDSSIDVTMQGDYRNYSIPPKSVLHLCHCKLFMSQRDYSCLDYFVFNTRDNDHHFLYWGGGKSISDCRLVIPQLFIVKTYKILEYSGFNTKICGPPPTLGTLAGSVIRSYRLDCHPQPQLVSNSVLRTVTENLIEKHEIVDRGLLEEPIRCPCADRYSHYPATRVFFLPGGNLCNHGVCGCGGGGEVF